LHLLKAIPFTEEDFNKVHACKIRSYLEKYNIPCRSFSVNMNLTNEYRLETIYWRVVVASMVGAAIIITNAAPVDQKNDFFINIIKLGQVAKSIGDNIGLENPGDNFGLSIIGESMIDYQQILSAIVLNPRPLNVSHEISLQLQRAAGANPIRADQRVYLNYIRNILNRSMVVVRKALAN